MEACVVMLIVSVFLAIIANVIPRKPKAKPEAAGHGRFECYYSGGKLYQQQFNDNMATSIQQVSECRFNPPIYAKYVVINAVGGGAGGSGGQGGEPGEFFSSFHSATRAALIFKPGKGGAAGADGSETKVFYEGEESGDPIIVANGGKSNREWADVRVSDIIQCGITSVDDVVDADGNITNVGTPACGSIPRCQILNDKIKVSFCFSTTNYMTKHLDLQDDIINRPTDEFVRVPEYDDINKTITYYDQSMLDEYGIDISEFLSESQSENVKDMVRESLAQYYPPMFEMVLTFNLHNSTTSTPSLLSNYLKAMGIEDGIGATPHGQGGAPSGAGTDGAVFVTW